MVELKLEDVLVRVAPEDPRKPVSDQRIALLREDAADRVLPIWIGSAEGNALAYRLVGDSPPRPMTSDLMLELIRVTGARVERVAITELREKTFYASIAIAVDGRTDELDARPSDALNLAIRAGAPILAAEAVLDEASMTRDAVAARLEQQADESGIELAPGEWASLSAELLRSLYTWPPKEKGAGGTGG
jgi:uncharacterized protein